MANPAGGNSDRSAAHPTTGSAIWVLDPDMRQRRRSGERGIGTGSSRPAAAPAEAVARNAPAAPATQMLPLRRRIPMDGNPAATVTGSPRLLLLTKPSGQRGSVRTGLGPAVMARRAPFLEHGYRRIATADPDMALITSRDLRPIGGEHPDATQGEDGGIVEGDHPAALERLHGRVIVGTHRRAGVDLEHGPPVGLAQAPAPKQHLGVVEGEDHGLPVPGYLGVLKGPHRGLIAGVHPGVVTSPHHRVSTRGDADAVESPNLGATTDTELPVTDAARRPPLAECLVELRLGPDHRTSRASRRPTWGLTTDRRRRNSHARHGTARALHSPRPPAGRGHTGQTGDRRE